ncbi:energy transducer TonB [Roseimaritima ulvae]|uniref:Transport protein TonB n=1 Tax=Roseimaritima ulvae TaxID=980254 RepID=A0A5B9QJ46_9BACT|nr:energy transducer TonB [Roseimaritima ulvae]QEG38924.1 transport protein TonB [Roseimaritima ulvae]
MNLPLRSTCISLLIHAIAAATLWCLPLTIYERFRPTGQQRVTAISLRLASPPAPNVSATTLTLSRVDPVSQAEPLPPERAQSLTPTVPARADVPMRPADLPASVQAPPTPEFVSVRRPPPPELPEVKTQQQETLPRRMASQSTPPSVDIVPLAQAVGLEPKTPADFSANRPPQYPASAVRQRLEGTVTLRLRVDLEGKVVEVEILKSSGHQTLDMAAAEAVQQWQGKPAQRFGRSIASEEILPVRFRL